MRPKARIEQRSDLEAFYRVWVGAIIVCEFLPEETARHLAAAWNACRDIETAELETLALAKILVEQKQI